MSKTSETEPQKVSLDEHNKLETEEENVTASITEVFSSIFQVCQISDV
jgi:hypothetical protein